LGLYQLQSLFPKRVTRERILALFYVSRGNDQRFFAQPEDAAVDECLIAGLNEYC
jgi:hypothetical protein